MKKMILIAAAVFAFASCTKDTIAPAEEENPQVATAASASGEPTLQTQNATIEWSGDPAEDGLGWVIHTSDGRVEVPENLNDEFKQDRKEVTVTFEPTDKRVPCRCAQPKYYVHILRIYSGLNAEK